ncbi:MAG: DNA-3-methyladenine glycosylase, partial [Fulvivirga sp.]|nr:DNA-3-methyladenine glycosylase [Fulvivirga sp.]
MTLPHSFYQGEDVTRISKDLLGKVLCTKINGVITSGKIVETEAYSYQEKACHAHLSKRTKRTEVLFREGGTAYVYLCYG